MLQGGLASVLAVAGLVAFATEASAHNNYFQSVIGACNSTPGTGATLTWTLYNDWNQTETGTFSTTQGILSTTTLSIAASPTTGSTPPNAAHQTFTQTLTAAQLAALTPSSTISVHWSATWSDGTPGSGTLSTTLAALNLPNGCVPVKTTPTIATTLSPPTNTWVSNSWGDSATVTGSAGGAAPAGSVNFYVCKSSTSPSSSSTCTTGGSLVGTVSSPSSSNGNASTYNLGSRYTPPNVGTYCFYTTYTPTSGEYYLTASGPAECFGVNPAYPGIVTTLVTPNSNTVGNAWSDSATVTGVSGGGTPFGSVSFYACKASSSPSSASTCTDPTGSLVGTVSSPSTHDSTSATYDLSPTTYTPPDVGTYCFYTHYSPTNDNYFPVWGPSECFGVYPAGTHTTTHTSADVIVIGGTAYDTATVTGDSAHGAPTGTVTFYSCAAPSSSGCTGGTKIPGTVPTPNPATLSASGAFTSTASSPTITPTAQGTYCFAAVYTPDVSKYSGSSDNVNGDVVSDECFTVGPATPTIATTLVTPASATVGNAWSDSATVTGNSTAGAPAGSVSFSVCKASSSPSSSSTCTTGGSLVGTVSSPSSTVGDASTYNLAPTTYTPPNVGTYCFYTSYTPAEVDNYTAASGPAECFSVGPATPDIATTLVTPASTSVGNAWSDSATVTGNSTAGAPAGSVSFSVCKASSSPSSSSTCTTGGSLVGTVSSPSSTVGDASTYNLAPTTYTPPNVGTYCFYTSYTPAEVENYTAASGPAECFSVSAADPQISTQQSGSHTGSGAITLGGSVTDTATVTGNSTGGAPTGTVTFTECGTGSAPAVCPSGTQVGSPVTLSGSGDSSTATSAAFTPSAAGTYCFAAVYTPDASSNYLAASDNTSGAVQASECFTVTAVVTAASTATPTTTTTVPPKTTPATTPAIAFTGALLSQEWMIGLAALLLGSGLVIAARWRRRNPRHVAK